jgi:DNA topoisomerase-6 subunit B
MSDGKTAEELAGQFREVSIAEFFEKNRHLLGYENTTKALITVVKEFVDNSLDATNEARILPDIKVNLKETSEGRFKIVVEDNGPGIVKDKLALAFGKLLYGTKFHRLVQGRGTQGIGASGAILYAQLTTGKPTKVISSTGKDIHTYELVIDTIKNQPHIISDSTEKNPGKWTGVRVELEVEGRYIEKGQSVLEYLKQTAMSNPYAKIIFNNPNGKMVFERASKEIPKQPKEIKPHPYGVELGILRRMLQYTKARNVSSFLTNDFSRVGKSSAHQICKLAKLNPKMKPQNLTHDEIEKLSKAMQNVKLIAPPTDCLSPLGENLLTEGLKKETGAEFAVAVTRPASVYRGNPFVVECALGFGGNIPTDQQAQLFRLANKVPLLYNQSDCALTEAAQDVDWRRYNFSQSSGQLPGGPLVILIHFASVWVPYTSEGKHAIAKYPEIVKEVKLALQDAGRKLGKYISGKRRLIEASQRQSLFESYIKEVSEAISKITGSPKERIQNKLEGMLKKGKIIEEAAKEVENNEEGRTETES